MFVVSLLLLLLMAGHASAVINDPVLYWKMDENTGTTLANSGSGGTINGTIVGGLASWLTGANCNTGFSSCVGFSITNAQVTMSHATGTTFTWAAWIYSATAGTNTYAVLWTSTAAASGLFLQQSSGGNNNKLNFYYTTDHFSTGTVARDTWVHVAVVNNAGAVTFYINGTASGTSSSAVGFTAVCMGYCGTASELVGRLDEVRVYSRALSGAEIIELRDFVPPAVAAVKRRAVVY